MSFAMDLMVPTPGRDLIPLSKVAELLLKRPVQYIVIETVATPVCSWSAEAGLAEQRQQTVESPVLQRPFVGQLAPADASRAGPLELVLQALAPSTSTALGASTATRDQSQSCEPATTPEPAASSPSEAHGAQEGPELAPGAWHVVHSRRSGARPQHQQAAARSRSPWEEAERTRLAAAEAWEAQQKSLLLERSLLKIHSLAAVVIQKMFRGLMARRALHQLRQNAANLAAHTAASGEAGDLRAPPKRGRQKHHQEWAEAGTTDDELLDAAIRDVQDELSQSSVQALEATPGAVDSWEERLRAVAKKISEVEALAGDSARQLEQSLRLDFDRILAEVHCSQTQKAPCSTATPASRPARSRGGPGARRPTGGARGRSRKATTS